VSRITLAFAIVQFQPIVAAYRGGEWSTVQGDRFLQALKSGRAEPVKPHNGTFTC